ncbi:MAG: lipopolysaccharide biosynthesis protein, partial [Myxococcota bacterium]
FPIGHRGDDLKCRWGRGGAHTGPATAVRHALDLISVVFLARLLTPADFGLIAMATAVLGFLATFRDAGLSTATVQREDLREEQVSLLFWLNVAVSVALVLAIAASSPLVAWFFGDERLVWITVVLGASFLFGGFEAQHAALLQRQMRFGTLAWTRLVAQAAGIVAAIAAALAGWGTWALVTRALVAPAVSLVLVWWAMPWRPGRPRLEVGARGLVRFGGYLSGFRAINHLGRNIDNLLIGRFLGGATLGLYSKAYALLMLPLNLMNAPISRVAVPALSRLQSDPERMLSYYAKALTLVVTFSMPVVAWLAAVADSFVLTVLGDQWRESIHLFRILVIPAFIGTFNVAVGWVFVSLGQVDRQLRCGLANTLANVLAVSIGIQWGVEGVAWALVVSSASKRLPTVAYCYWGTPFTLRLLGGVLWRPAAASLLAGWATWLVHGWLAPGAWPPLALAASLPIFAAVYLLALLGLPGGRALVLETVDHLRLLRGQPAEALG